MGRKNILITSAGRRVELLKSFQDQSKQLLKNALVYAIDVEPSLSAACQVADKSEQSPRADNENYGSFILDFCRRNDIGLVIPTIDTELEKLAALQPNLLAEGTHAIISSSNFVGLCRDKRQSGVLFESISIRYPTVYELSNAKFPCFVKPLDGSSSIGAKVVYSRRELTKGDKSNPKLMFMQLIGKDHIEYTVDAYFDRQGVCKCIVPRERIKVRSGEVSIGATRCNALFYHLEKSLHGWKEARGCITIQVFFNEASGSIYGLEVNPRFGGGYPLSYAAGANFPGWLIREYLKGETIDKSNEWERDLVMLRYDAQVMVQHG
jgi:carbamoyl-phosphate synthase large subunit